MFGLFKKRKNRNKKGYKTAQSASFKDLMGKEVVLEIKTNGNDTLLLIRDKKQDLQFALDKELVSLLDVLLQSYVLHEVFPDFEEEL